MVPVRVLSLLRELSALPYENLSKIVAFHHGGSDLRTVEKALDLSSGWLERSRDTGAGGTCFSLTWWLHLRLREEGYATAFLLADKGRSRDIHCGLRLDLGGRGYLLDPGYMIFDPLPLPGSGLASALWSSPNEVILEDTVTTEGRVWRLSSGPRGASKWRFDFRQSPAPEAGFLRAWEASYAFPMMGYPVLNRIRDGNQYYLQKRSLLVRTPGESTLRKLGREELLEALEGTFGIPGGLARDAIGIVLASDQAFFRK